MSSHDTEREIISLVSVLIRTLFPFMRTPASCPNYLPKVPSPNTITLRIRASTHEFGVTNIKSIPEELMTSHKFVIMVKLKNIYVKGTFKP